MKLATKRYGTRFLMFGGFLCVVCANPLWVRAQTPTGDCIDYNGHVVRCSVRPGGGSSGGEPTYTGPTEAEIKAEQAREAERARLAAEQRKWAAEHRADEERRQQEHDEWLRSVASAAGSLKGVSTDDGQLKGVSGGNTNFFGLKGVSPEEAASDPNFGIKTGEPGGTPQSVQGAWQQLHCAAAFAGDAVADLKKIETGEAGASELDEIHFVAGQASAVMHGGPVTVDTSTCAGSGPMPVNLSSADIARETPVIDGLLTRTIHDADTYVASQQKADALRQRLETLKAQSAAPDAQRPASGPDSKPPAAPATQNPPLRADQQQKANESKKSDYLALLRETQRALNDANSQKISSQADADRVEKQTQAIMAGQFSPPSSGTQSQPQKKKMLRGDQ